MTETVVAEGQVKFRDGKKWKSRWVVLQKPSPVADCLTLLVCKEKKKGKILGHKDRLNITLEGICGVEPGAGYDGVSYTLSVLCLAHTLVLGFSSRDALLAWDTRIRYSLGEVHRFSVGVEPGTKLESGPASLHLCNNLLVLTRSLPPVVIGSWKLSALRRYGAVPNGFVFEGGTRCGLWAGVYFLSCSEGEQISFLIDCVVRGVSPSSTLCGLRPSQPGGPDASAEERISQETTELEKRLSLLSSCSLASISASTYSCSTSVAEDNRSISSSSSSQSNSSFGSIFPFWVEPSASLRPSMETAASSSALKALTRSDDRLYGSLMGGSRSRPSSAQLLPRGLHDSGRQSSLDSGIGIATGSQSSHSGSYSSCTGSLDMATPGGREGFGSVVSLAAPPDLPCSPPSAPPRSPPSSPVSSSQPHPSRGASRASSRHSQEYQIPSLLRRWYDTPRSLLQALSLRGPSPRGAPSDPSSRPRGGGQEQMICRGVKAEHLGAIQRSLSWGSEKTPSGDADQMSTPRPDPVPGSPAYKQTQVQTLFFTNFPPNSTASTPAGPKCCEKEKLEDVCELKALRMLLSPPPPCAPGPTSACAKLAPPQEAGPFPPSGPRVDYENIPKASERKLHRHDSAPTPSCSHGGSLQLRKPTEDAIRYAHLDMAAMVTAQRVWAEPVGGRKDRRPLS
ncbi:protein Dok-7 isoform X1 [Nothobranchius furzeri]|uniref:protein Dok-7 isoform X1 n=1 Tax=Nothobranchius furzeri TaxID=105023 RepID=UPI0039049BB9